MFFRRSERGPGFESLPMESVSSRRGMPRPPTHPPVRQPRPSPPQDLSTRQSDGNSETPSPEPQPAPPARRRGCPRRQQPPTRQQSARRQQPIQPQQPEDSIGSRVRQRHQARQ